MNQATFAWAAFKNMMRQTVRDPVWAITALIAAPFRAGPYVLKLGFFFLIVAIALFVGARYLLDAIGLQPGDLLWIAADVAITAFLAVLGFRFLTNPMIEHFGGMDGDTHGTARFATNKEVAPLTRQQSGLLVGRDGKTGKLLRYDGPAHLMTMARRRAPVKVSEPSSRICSSRTAP